VLAELTVFLYSLLRYYTITVRIKSHTGTISYENNVGVIHPNNVSHRVSQMLYKKRDEAIPARGNVTYYCQGMQAKSVGFELV